ncbi:hypothetical protein LTR37_001974 [Vermiconidia calcicola]|uniref:Uncharacterized protein n=1 Tax=Vermiconidia calcicola TaxID=1690605 RepID=A0ACC3NUQ8_9PEZI|nr:hypothetical protein LTR37_001974 [Vermiconidia calcicola]
MANSNISTSPCSNCFKRAWPGRPAHHLCGKCHKTACCNKTYQTVDWKRHKANCGKTDEPSLRSRIEERTGAKGLHELPEDDVYRFLIDSFRLRVGDELHCGAMMYKKEISAGDMVARFKDYLKQAETAGQLLPEWWNEEKREACVAKGDRKDHFSTLHREIPQEQVEEQYGGEILVSSRMRLFAEEATGLSQKEALAAAAAR